MVRPVQDMPLTAFANKSERVEKYRPDTLDDVSGHQDILATINKFVETNARTKSFLHDNSPWTDVRSDYPTSSYTVRQALEKLPRF